ncbi:unnamed protein product [Lasius platythorax]|uniref:C2H2-type domain-containing protein n=1 Tax=Lasius platythorax TaxID=488582 RepID=A0AAV2NQB6_9HYME
MLELIEIRDRLRDYFTLKDNEIICDFCENSYDIIINIEDVRNHLKDIHKEYENAVSSESTEEDLKKSYTIHNNTIKCKHCEHSYIPWNAHSIIQYHLGDGHQTDKVNVEGMRNLIREKYELNESDRKQYCKNCQKDIQNRLVDLINHLDKVHEDTDHLNYRPSHEW